MKFITLNELGNLVLKDIALTLIEQINEQLKEINYKLSYSSETNEVLLEKIDIIEEELPINIPSKPEINEPENIEEVIEVLPDDEISEEPPTSPKYIITTGLPYLNKDISVKGAGNFGTVARNIVLEILDESPNYYKVTYKGNTGWVSKLYVNVYVPAKPEWEAKADKLIEDAISQMGIVKYVFNKNSPDTMEFDCSSWTKYLFNKHGIINLYWGARKQSTYGTKINDKKDLRKGDLVFFNSKANREKYPTPGDINRIGHVGIYIGEGKFIHNLNPTSNVVISSIDSSNWIIRYESGARVID